MECLNIQRLTGEDTLSIKDSQKLKMLKLKTNSRDVLVSSDKCFVFNEQLFVIIDDAFDYYKMKLERNPILIVKNNPKINIERLLLSLKPSMVILTTANYKQVSAKIKSTCKKLQVPIYDVEKKGAFTL